jgi:hypothetical protein
MPPGRQAGVNPEGWTRTEEVNFISGDELKKTASRYIYNYIDTYHL